MLRSVQTRKRYFFYLVCALIFARLVGLLAQPYGSLISYSDLLNYFRVAQIPGWPYFQFWSEFPPIFPLLSAGLFRLTGGIEQVYVYCFSLFLICIDSINLILFCHLSEKIYPQESSRTRQVLFLGVIIVLPYFQWYFDSFVLLFSLLGLMFLLDEKPNKAGLVTAIGVLLKIFPVLIFPAVWKKWPFKKAMACTLVIVLILVIVYGSLFVFSPDFTVASLVSQANKGSWETIWALIDQNYRTGNFGALEERLDPLSAFRPIGNPAVFSPWITLIIFGGIGYWRWRNAQIKNGIQIVALIGFSWCMFFLWAPGWSPQWEIYLITFLLLGLPVQPGILLGTTLILVNLLEWPVLFSRGQIEYLPFTIIMRTILIGLTALQFNQVMAGELSADHD